MNKRLMVLLLVAILLLAVGCKNNADTADIADTTEATESSLPLETETNPVIPEEPVLGVGTLDESLTNPFENPEEAEQETTENSGSADNGNNDGSNTEEPSQSGNETPTEPDPTESEATEPDATEPEGGNTYVSYEEYNNMTPAEQVAYYNQFPSMEAFVEWYKEAKAEYDKEHGSVDVGDGNIDLGDIVKP